MSSGSKIVIIIAVAVVGIVVIVGGLMVAGVGLFWFRTTAHEEDMAQHEALAALEEAMAQKADDVAAPAAPEAA